MNTSLVCVDVYTACEGDTLDSVAERYGLSVSLLMKANGIEEPCGLRAGTRLCIPGTPEQLPVAPKAAAECPVIHKVIPGDTLYLIARKHGIKLDELMRANPNVDPYNLLVGTELFIPSA